MSGNFSENPIADPKVDKDCFDQTAQDEIYCYNGRLSDEFLEKVLAACSKCEYDGDCVNQREAKLILAFKPAVGGWPEFTD